MTAELSERSKGVVDSNKIGHQTIEVVDLEAVNKKLKVRLELNQIPIGQVTRYTNANMPGKDFVRGQIVNDLAKALGMEHIEYSRNSLVDLRTWAEINGGKIEYKFGLYAGRGDDTYEIILPNFTGENLTIVEDIQSWNDIGGKHVPAQWSPKEGVYRYIAMFINDKFWGNIRTYHPNDGEIYLDIPCVTKIADMFGFKKPNSSEAYIEVLPWILDNGGKAQVRNVYSEFGKELSITFPVGKS